MVSVSTFAYLFFVGLALLVYGRKYEDYTVGILGGFTIFLLSIYILINPLAGIDGWFNTVIGSVLFGVGTYIWVRGSIEAIGD